MNQVGGKHSLIRGMIFKSKWSVRLRLLETILVNTQILVQNISIKEVNTLVFIYITMKNVESCVKLTIVRITSKGSTLSH